jgi:hypothetical protein
MEYPKHLSFTQCKKLFDEVRFFISGSTTNTCLVLLTEAVYLNLPGLEYSLPTLTLEELQNYHNFTIQVYS